MSSKEQTPVADFSPEQGPRVDVQVGPDVTERPTERVFPAKVRDVLREARVSEADFAMNIAHFEAVRGSSDYQALLLDIQFVLRHWEDDFSKDLRTDAYPRWSRPVFLALLETLGESSELSPEEEREQVFIADFERKAEIRKLIEERQSLEGERQGLRRTIEALSNEGPALFIDHYENSLQEWKKSLDKIDSDYAQLNPLRRLWSGKDHLKRRAKLNAEIETLKGLIAQDPLTKRQAEEEERQRQKIERIEGMKQKEGGITRRLEEIASLLD